MKHENGAPWMVFSWGLVILLGLNAESGLSNTKGWGFGAKEDKKISKLVEGPSKLVCDTMFEDFRSSTPGEFPQGWKPKYDHYFEEVKEKKLYVVDRDSVKGNVLKATYGTHTTTILKAFEDWDLEKYPGLQWEWKATVLPEGADESDSSKNDSAASVYVVWNVGFPMQAKALRFAWSSTQKVGSVFKRRMDHDNIFILQSGKEHLNQWRTETVNVRDLYNEHILLSKRNRKPFALVLTTDADATASKAQAYYANFKLCREVSQK